MRTLLICPALYGSTGGIERILQLYLRTLLKKDPNTDRVRLAVLNDDVLPSTIVNACEASVATGRHRLTFIRHLLRLARGCDRLLCGHINLLPLTAFAALLSPSARYALVAHGIEVWERPNLITRWALRRADRILCVSDFTRRRMLELDPRLKPERMIVLPNALDIGFAEAALQQPQVEATSPVILTVSRLTKADDYKGIDHLIIAMPFIRKVVPDAQLRIVGDGDDRTRLENLAKGFSDNHAVTFTGRIDDHTLQAEFRQCRIFALPSAKEGFGLVYLEAMACGRPCVAADEGGAPEVVTPESGALVPYGDVPALVKALIASLQRDWDAKAIRARAADFSPERFGIRFLAAWPILTN